MALPNYGGPTPFYKSATPPRVSWTEFPKGAGAHIQQMSGLGQAGPVGYAVASWIGATLSGGLIGFVASAETRGAIRGASFASGLAGVSDAFLFLNQNRKMAAVLTGILGVGSMSWAIWDFSQRRR